MSWITAGIAAAGLVKGVMDSNSARKQEKNAMMANAAVMENSPWTGMQTNVMAGGKAPSALSGALQGGMAGAMMGQQFSKGTTDPTPKTETPPPGGGMTADQMGTGAMSAVPGGFAGTQDNNAWLEMQKRQKSLYGGGTPTMMG